MASNILAGDQLNFTRMGIASVDEIKVVLADILRCEIKPQHLPKSITSCSELTTGRHKLRPEQQKLCCVSPPAKPDYNKFDVSLLYALIRNLCPQLKPTQGWGKTTSITDLQVGDDIERLREFRNEMFAHLDSSGVEDVVFTSKWKDLEQIFHRMQMFLNSKGISVDYSKKLAIIAKSDFGYEDMEKYKIILEGILHILKENGNNGGPSITIHGNDEVFFGEKTCFLAILDQCSPSNNWPISWEKIQGNITEQLDTSREKYRGSSSRCLVIADVSKEDEGEYRAVISRENNGTHMKIPSNSKRLTVIGDCPTLTMPKEVEVPYGSVAVLQPVIEACPPPKSIEWQKSKCMDPNSEDYKIFDLTKPKYLGSTLDQTNSKLVINDTSFEDGLFYRLLVENMVGKSTCSTFLNVVGTPPNVIMKDDTDFQERSITLICKILCESTHPLTGVVWTKDNSTIDVLSCNGKYTGGGIENPSLTINNLNASDAGVYQCCVSNIVGSTHSEQVILAVPNVKLLMRDRDIENKVLKLQASIKSVPDAFKVEWKVKMTPGDEFRPINIHEETYMGSTISLPNPLLIVNKYNAKNLQSYRIEVTNFLGLRIVTSQEALKEKQLPRESGMDCLNGVNLSIYKDNGIKIRFNNLRRALIEQISGPEMIILKDSLKEILAVDEESLNSVNSVTEFLNLLKHKEVFTDRDVITMQYLTRLIKRPDLEQKCIDFATSRKERLCYFQEEKHTDGCSRVRLHVVDDIENFIKLESLIETVAAIVECDPKSIQVVGVIRESSFIILIEVEKKLAKTLLKNREEMLKLAEYKVDRIEIDGYVINIEKTEFGGASFSSETTSFFFGMELEEEFFALFRRVLLHYQPTHSFGEKLWMYKKSLQPLLNPSQYRLLYVQPDIYSNVNERCDIPLIYILFKTICGISPHRNGWGNPPDPSDNCLAADIDRIMEIYGMYCGNAPPLSLTKSTFGFVFKSAVDIMLNIEKTLKFSTWQKTSGPKGRQREDGDWLHSEESLITLSDDSEKIERGSWSFVKIKQNKNVPTLSHPHVCRCLPRRGDLGLDSHGSDAYDYPDLTNLAPIIRPKYATSRFQASLGVTKQDGKIQPRPWKEKFSDMTTEEVVNLFKTAKLTSLASVCEREVLDGSFFGSLSETELKSAFKLSDFQISKVNKIIHKGWRPDKI